MCWIKCYFTDLPTLGIFHSRYAFIHTDNKLLCYDLSLENMGKKHFYCFLLTYMWMFYSGCDLCHLSKSLFSHLSQFFYHIQTQFKCEPSRRFNQSKVFLGLHVFYDGLVQLILSCLAVVYQRSSFILCFYPAGRC